MERMMMHSSEGWDW